MSLKDQTGLAGWQIVLGLEAIAAMIALVMPLTPSKTGSTTGIPHLFFDEPTYLQEIAVHFVATNALIGLIALAAWIWLRRGLDG